MSVCLIPVFLSLLAGGQTETPERVTILDLASCTVHKSDPEFADSKPMPQITSDEKTGISVGTLARWTEAKTLYNIFVVIRPTPEKTEPDVPGFLHYKPDLDPHRSDYSTALTFPTKVSVGGRAGRQHEDLYVSDFTTMSSITVSVPVGKGELTIEASAFLAFDDYKPALSVLESEVKAILDSWKWSTSKGS